MSIIGLQSVFPIYAIAFMPNNLNELNEFGKFLSYFGIATGCIVPSALLMIAIVKGGKPSPKNNFR